MPRAKDKSTKVIKKSQSVKKSAALKTQKVKTKAAPSKQTSQKKTSKKTTIKATTSKLSAPVFDINGHSQGIVGLPKEIFGQKVNQKLLAQAIRVYFNNQSAHHASTKTRSEVRGGGKKPWKQKGTGRARAGSRRSPLWVGGGIALGPKYRKTTLTLPKKMKRKALVSALSAKNQAGEIKIITNFEKIEPKTKVVANLFAKLGLKNNILVVLGETNQNVKLATRNIPKISVDLTKNLNAYEVIQNNQILFSKEALLKFT